MKTEELSKELFGLLAASGLTLATAESCTGGAVAAAIVGTSGASEYFRGGVVAYCNEVKERVLGVSGAVIAAQTAVSEEVARQMARGVKRVTGADFAVATTGTAGPGGGTEAIPVGTIWLCCTDGERDATLKLTADNGRKANLANAVNEALRLLVGFVRRAEEVRNP